MTATVSLEALARRVCQQHNLEFVSIRGRGAFKQVFLVQEHGRNLALKLLHSGADPDRTRREVQAHLSCNHQNISKLLDLGTVSHEGVTALFYIEEFLSGGTLEDCIADGRLSHSKGIALAQHMSAAIAHLAERGIVHRDIKPANILYRGDDIPVLIDLGIARHLNEASLTQDWLGRGPGTPLYAPPEQLLNQKALIDWRADQFSLGVTLAVAVFGTHPFAPGTTTPEEIVEKVSRRELIANEVRSSIAQTPFEPILTMIEPWPVKRFTRPAQLVDAWAARV